MKVHRELAALAGLLAFAASAAGAQQAQCDIDENSPKEVGTAAFLVQHLETKRLEAQKLARASSQVERMTAALYNGGSHNVKRMLSGLIASLPETDKYMKKVPATRRRLDAQVALVDKDRSSRRTR